MVGYVPITVIEVDVNPWLLFLKFSVVIQVCSSERIRLDDHHFCRCILSYLYMYIILCYVYIVICVDKGKTEERYLLVYLIICFILLTYIFLPFYLFYMPSVGSIHFSRIVIYIYIYILYRIHVISIYYIYIIKVEVKLATVVEGDQKAPFSIATTPRCSGGRHSFPWIAPLYTWYVPYIAVC